MISAQPFVTVFAGSSFEAGMVRALLEHHGIAAHLDDENIGTVAPYLAAGGGAGPSRCLWRRTTSRARKPSWPGASEAAMRLDLRRDFADVYAYVAEQVRRFDPTTYDGPGDPGPVKAIELGFEFEQGGWVVVVFDTRPDAEPDGEWTMHIDGKELERPHWREASDANLEGPITLINPDGSESVLPAGSELATPLGDLLKGVLLQARADGVFAPLPRTADCELGVEHLNGAYGWPEYEARGEENRV